MCGVCNLLFLLVGPPRSAGKLLVALFILIQFSFHTSFFEKIGFGYSNATAFYDIAPGEPH